MRSVWFLLAQLVFLLDTLKAAQDVFLGTEDIDAIVNGEKQSESSTERRLSGRGGWSNFFCAWIFVCFW